MIATECDRANCSATVMTGPEAGTKPAAAPRPAEMAAVGDAGTTASTLTADDRKLFLKQVVVWPGKDKPGWINLHCHLKNTDPSKNRGKDFVIGWPFKTADDLISRATWLQGTSQFFDSWFCTSQQSECGTSKSSGKPKAKRLASNATWLKAIWVDVDIKPCPAPWSAENPGQPWTHYETMEEAWTAFSAFRVKVGLPAPSAVVNSGGGLHIYWIADAAMTPDDWRGYAEGLKTLLLREAVKCDTGLTTDSVRILRVPGTLNHKYSPPRPVELIHLGTIYNFATALAFLKTFKLAGIQQTLAGPAAPIGPMFTATAPDLAFADLPSEHTLQAGLEPSGRMLADPMPIFEQCAFLRDALANGGADYNNPLWNLSVLCTAFMESGNELAHKISKGHKTYTEADTQALYDRKVADRAERDVGYPSCAAIAGAGCKTCTACPLFAKGKSPLNIRPAAVNADPNATTTNQSAAHQPAPEWPDGCNRQGAPVKGYANTLAAIRKLNITCKLDTFRQKEFSEGHVLPSLDGELSDRAVTMLGDEISSRFGFYPGKDILREALTAKCLRNAFNPVVDYFNILRWDGAPRLKKLLHRYLGADDTALNDAISTKLMCAIVRRSKHPGCKYDHEVVLQGDQGARKSMFCEDLAVFPDLFTDAGDLAGSIKEQMEIAQGKQIIEFAELAGFSQNSRERNKAYLSRRVDRARLAYGHYAKDQPRSSVPIGTTNPGGYLNDPTGERRYWHVAVRTYDREAFLADKDQLYAEAVVLEPNERLWLDTPELGAAHDAIVATAKEPNTLVDDLHDLIGDFWQVSREKTDTGWLIHQEERVSNREVRAKLGLIGVSAHGMRDLGRRISDAMTSLGWTKAPGTLVCKHGGSAEGGYRRTTADRFEASAAERDEAAEGPTTDVKDTVE